MPRFFFQYSRLCRSIEWSNISNESWDHYADICRFIIQSEILRHDEGCTTKIGGIAVLDAEIIVLSDMKLLNWPHCRLDNYVKESMWLWHSRKMSTDKTSIQRQSSNAAPNVRRVNGTGFVWLSQIRVSVLMSGWLWGTSSRIVCSKTWDEKTPVWKSKLHLIHEPNCTLKCNMGIPAI